MGVRSRWRRVLPTATLTAVTFTLAERPALALFPPVWRVSPPVTVVTPPPNTPPVIVVPPVVPPPFVPIPPPPGPPPVPPPVPPPPPSSTPEPSTLVAGLAGLAAAAGWAARRR